MLEYCFVEAPGGRNDKTHGIPNLELMVANDPAFFAKPVSLVYERNDYCQDPPGWHSDSHDRRKVAAEGRADDSILLWYQPSQGPAMGSTVLTSRDLVGLSGTAESVAKNLESDREGTWRGSL